MAPPFFIVIHVEKIEILFVGILILYQHSITKCSTQLKPLI
jgi:hypothetical protein